MHNREDVYVHLSTGFILETILHISIKCSTGRGAHWKLSNEFHFGTYQSSINPALCDDEVEFKILQKRLIVHKISTWH